MAGLLASIKGRFILSLNDCPEVPETFAAFDLQPVSTRYSSNIKAARRANGLLISN